jgi:hypothetical protein
MGITKSTDYKFQLKGHRQVAILPVQIRVVSKKLPKDTTYEQLRIRNEEMSKLFQVRMYESLYQSTEKNKTPVIIQPIDLTDSVLYRQNINSSNIDSQSLREMAILLGVDAVIYSQIDITYNISDGGSVAISVISRTVLPAGINVPPGEASVKVRIAGQYSSPDIWNYNSIVPHPFTMEHNKSQETLFRRFLWYPLTKMPYIGN